MTKKQFKKHIMICQRNEYNLYIDFVKSCKGYVSYQKMFELLCIACRKRKKFPDEAIEYAKKAIDGERKIEGIIKNGVPIQLNPTYLNLNKEVTNENYTRRENA